MAVAKLCNVPGCDKAVAQKGMCRAHYMRVWRYGSPESRQNKPVVVPWLERHVNFTSDECLIWPFSRNQDGYGSIAFRDGRTSTIASRFMCRLAHGEPPEGQFYQAAHSCGNGHLGCVNPRHLSWKTVAENADDKFLHGTVCRGERVGRAKLTSSDVIDIRAMKERGVPTKEIASRFAISDKQVGSIYRRENWRHI